MTTHSARHSVVLADDGITDLSAVEIAACGARPVALISPDRQLAAARILAQGGTPYLISKPLHVRQDGRGWRTTSDALLALSPAARTREHRRIAREELAQPSEEKRRTQL
jgi:hypothetical protein